MSIEEQNSKKFGEQSSEKFKDSRAEYGGCTQGDSSSLWQLPSRVHFRDSSNRREAWLSPYGLKKCCRVVPVPVPPQVDVAPTSDVGATSTFAEEPLLPETATLASPEAGGRSPL